MNSKSNYGIYLLDSLRHQKQYVGNSNRIDISFYTVDTYKSMNCCNLILVEQFLLSNVHDFNRHAKFTTMKRSEKDMNIRRIIKKQKGKWIKHLRI